MRCLGLGPQSSVVPEIAERCFRFLPWGMLAVGSVSLVVLADFFRVVGFWPLLLLLVCWSGLVLQRLRRSGQVAIAAKHHAEKLGDHVEHLENHNRLSEAKLQTLREAVNRHAFITLCPEGRIQ